MAWVFSGMAVRLAFDLGLHAATRSYVEEGVMNEDEARSRSNTFWGVFINDSVLSLNLGRPFHTNIDEIAAEKPKCSSIDQHSDIWIAYTQPEDTTKSMDQALNPKSSLLYSWIALYEIMCALGHSLTDVPKLELQILAEKTFERLLAFKSNLPPDMALTQESLDHYSLRRAHIEIVHVTFTAALILVYAIISAVPDSDHADLPSHLDVCCKALADLGEAFGSATRALDILLAIKRSWQARSVASFGGKK
ncbi:hypothetical protein LTR17_025373 [Elasticomyces elasticus]|nr:hypothetical protein LTR17_025373 [Elasticomyces elasticus]